jgi:hypothetical protein
MDIEDIIETKNLPNLSIAFYVEYQDRLTGSYSFDIEVDIGSNLVAYVVDKKTSN